MGAEEGGGRPPPPAAAAIAVSFIAVSSIVANLSTDHVPGGGSVTDGTAEGAKMGEDGSGIATVTPAASAAATVATVVVDPFHQPPPTAVRPQCAERLQGMSGVASSPTLFFAIILPMEWIALVLFVWVGSLGKALHAHSSSYKILLHDYTKMDTASPQSKPFLSPQPLFFSS